MRREASGLADLSWAGALCTSGQELQLGTSDYGGLTLPGGPVSCREGRTFWKHGLCTFRLVRGLASGSGPPGTFSAFPSWHPWVALRGWRAWGGRSGLAWALLSPPAPTPTPRWNTGTGGGGHRWGIGGAAEAAGWFVMSPSAMAPGGPGLCPLSHPRAQTLRLSKQRRLSCCPGQDIPQLCLWPNPRTWWQPRRDF